MLVRLLDVCFIPTSGIDEGLQKDASSFYHQRLELSLVKHLHDLRKDVTTEIQGDVLHLWKDGCLLLGSEYDGRRASVEQGQMTGEGQILVDDHADRVLAVPTSGSQRGIVQKGGSPAHQNSSMFSSPFMHQHGR